MSLYHLYASFGQNKANAEQKLRRQVIHIPVQCVCKFSQTLLLKVGCRISCMAGGRFPLSTTTMAAAAASGKRAVEEVWNCSHGYWADYPDLGGSIQLKLCASCLTFNNKHA